MLHTREEGQGAVLSGLLSWQRGLTRTKYWNAWLQLKPQYPFFYVSSSSHSSYVFFFLIFPDYASQEVYCFQGPTATFAAYIHGKSKARLIRAFLQIKNKVRACIEVILAKEDLYGAWRSQPAPKEVTSIHLAAHFGLQSVVNEPVSLSVPYDEEVSNRHTPLFWAAASGQGRGCRTASSSTWDGKSTATSLLLLRLL